MINNNTDSDTDEDQTDDQNGGLTIPDEPDDDDFDTVLDGRATDVDQGGDGDD